MTEDEVLKRIRKEADDLPVTDTVQGDTIMQFLSVLAESQALLPPENFDRLMHIAALLYKEGLSNFRARTEVAVTMDASVVGDDTARRDRAADNR
jgi:hypothetical protein